MALLPSLWRQGQTVVMCGGSMMYVDAVTRGLDELPTVSDAVRDRAIAIYRERGLEALHEALGRVDPVSRDRIDPANHKRLIHALEVSMEAGRPYSSLITGLKRQRPFRVLKYAIAMERERLFDRINRRVGAMVENGLEQEARSLYPLRHLNALNTVGYKEMFAMMDGRMDRDTAIARIAKNTRVYAKKQITWLKRDPDVTWLTESADMATKIIDSI